MDCYQPANTNKNNANLIPPSDEDFQELPPASKSSWRDSSQYCYKEFKESYEFEGKPTEDIYLPQ